MTTAIESTDLRAPPEAVYVVVADPARLPEWEITYDSASRPRAEPGEAPSFTAHRVLGSREMLLRCHVVDADPPAHFAFDCSGDAGEQVHEDFQLTSGRDGGTRLTRTSDFALGRVDPLAAIPGLTYTRTWLDVDVQHSFARLASLMGAAYRGRSRLKVGTEAEGRSA